MRTTRYITVLKSGALVFFSGNAANPATNGMSQLSNPIPMARTTIRVWASIGHFLLSNLSVRFRKWIGAIGGNYSDKAKEACEVAAHLPGMPC
jgi:polyisoprenoid-binding protein YceI